MSATVASSCPGYLDRFGIWNNGFDCFYPKTCCGTETNRYCCSLPSTSSKVYDDFIEIEPAAMYTGDLDFNEKWFLLQIFTTALCLLIILLMIIGVYLCLIAVRISKLKKKRNDIVRIPFSPPTPIYLEGKRSTANRISTITCATSTDMKSRLTDSSMVFDTVLNMYPTKKCRQSTVSSSSYYLSPNELEYLCK